MSEQYNSLKRKEVQELLAKTGDIARQEAFPKGNPIIYMKDGQMLKEYPDGRIEKIDGIIEE